MLIFVVSTLKLYTLDCPAYRNCILILVKHLASLFSDYLGGTSLHLVAPFTFVLSHIGGAVYFDVLLILCLTF